MHDPHDNDNDASTSEPSRYDSAIGFEPKPAKLTPEQRRQKDRAFREYQQWSAPSAFTARAANETVHNARRQTTLPLLGDLWHEGELLLVAGAPGTGKSVLAAQIAESLARGLRTWPSDEAPKPTNNEQRTTNQEQRTTNQEQRTTNQEHSSPTTDHRPLATLLLDLEHSDAQFAERYTAEDPFGRRKARYRFSKHLKRASFAGVGIPRSYAGRYDEYLLHSFTRTAAETGARVIVIDNLTLLDLTGKSGSSVIWMRFLRKLASETGLSILVTYPLRESSRRGPLTLAGLPAAACRVMDSADSVIAIARTAFAPDHRYLKHLKCIRPAALIPGTDARASYTGPGSPTALEDLTRDLLHAPHDAQVLKLQKTPGPSSSRNNEQRTTINEPRTNSPFTTHNSPFLGLTSLGTSPESLHLHDYSETPRYLYPRKPRATKYDKVVDMYLDPAYGRYLKGE